MNPFSKQDERKLLEAGRRFFSTAFPNPNRAGCPGQDILRAIAFRKLERQKAKEWDDHLSHCSPCFNEYMAFREEAQRSARLRMIAAAAAVVVIGIGAWLVFRGLTSRPKREDLTAHNTNVTYQAKRWDLREKSPLRGGEPNPSGFPDEFPKAALDLSIYLPTGSEPGKYEIEVVQPPSSPLFRSEGSAALRDHIAELEVKLNLGPLPPGLYLVGIRQAGGSWTYYPVVLK